MSIVEPLTAEIARIIRARIDADRLVLPAFPATATRCSQLLKDPNVNTKRVATLLESDPVFAALVLRAASTANFGGQPAASLEQAIGRLGLNSLRSLLIQAAARAIFESSDRAINQRMALVWKHSVAVAVMARDIAALMQAGDGETAYLAGLLHDVGKPIVAGMLRELERSLGRKVQLTPEQFTAAIDQTHRPVGIALAEKWNLPADVITAITDCSEYTAGDRKNAANIVRFANALVKKHGLASGSFDSDDVGAMIMIGRSMLALDEDVVGRLAGGLNQRLEAITTAA
ncbi:MAG: HDOD domain-containing protein [Kofleriaceae bacterium]|nr:HDOD domain-containing protein [Kofleriaceae bacterium]MBP9167498.1 HDOD domain-containing protein [Kofleriaceae bacterium]MBP9856579.1 HDOD domain-containing protein [Kofleriaceae bacterium]